MNKNIVIPKNDVFFYGLSLRSRDVSDVRNDIFSNILMKYLTSLRPVSSRLYRTADNAKYEYNYTFVPSKPLSWRVIKNRRIVEDIEQLSDGKYCLNYYDDNGNDVKRVIFNSQHRWTKTNYYNSIYGENLICSLIPKEVNAETVIMQYITGEPYPVTLRCCPVASCEEVLSNVLERVPMPEVTALTNYGLLYYACEETYNIFSQVLSQEEEKYKEAHKPPVYNTEEDVAGGFCFDVENFDTTKSLDSRFDFLEAEELTEEGFTEIVSPMVSDDFSEEENSEVAEVPLSEEIVSDHYSIDDDIALAIKMISEATSIQIDENLLKTESAQEVSIETEPLVVTENPDIADIDSTIVKISVSATEVETVSDELSDDTINTIISEEVIPEGFVSVDNSIDEEISADSEPEIVTDFADIDSADLLSMDDSAIDDYVSTLIDSLLLDAKTTVSELNLDKEDAFAAGTSEFNDSNVSHVNTLSDFNSENIADSIIESNGANYYYYGDLDDNGDRTGRGRTLMSDGKLAYDGEYLNDMRHGKGSFFYKDGSLCFYGDWNENMRNGFGMGISSETGIIHTGNWSNNRPQGIGVRFDSDGKFMYLDSACEKTNGGIRIVGFGENSIFVEFWNEKTLKVVKKEISLDDLIN